MSTNASLPTPQTSRKRKPRQPTFTSQPGSPTGLSSELARQDSFSPCPTKKQKLLTPEVSFGQRFEQALQAQAETHSYQCALSSSFSTSRDHDRDHEGEVEYETQATIPLVAAQCDDDAGYMHIGLELGVELGRDGRIEVDSEDSTNAVLTAFTYRLATLHVSISSLKRARRKVEAVPSLLSNSNVLQKGPGSKDGEIGGSRVGVGKEEEEESSQHTKGDGLSNPLHLQPGKQEVEERKRAKDRLRGLTQLLDMAQAHLADVLVEREALRDALDEDFGDGRREDREGVVREAETELRRLVRRYEERLYKMLGALSPEAMRRTVAEMGVGAS